MSRVVVVTPPEFEPVSLAEAKAHLNAKDYDDDDTIIGLYIKAATRWAENFTGRAFVDRIVDYYEDAFPSSGAIYLPMLPIVSLTGVFYGGEDSETEMDAATYGFDPVKGRVFMGANQSWPTFTAVSNGVRIRYRAGYTLDESPAPALGLIPDEARIAILLVVGSLYDKREDMVIGQSVAQVPRAAENFIRPLRVNTAIA